MERVQKPRWLSIKDAAEYLEVGEPTIYRWMRDNRITYRKVGDSTRFLQQDLDAVVQVHAAEGDAGRIREYCPICRGDELVAGTMRSTGLVSFQPEKVRFWRLSDSYIPIEARMCTKCGAVFQFGDAEKLRTLTERRGQTRSENGNKTDNSP